MGKNRVCPVERSGGLDNTFRRWVQDPKKILKPYVRRDMTVLDLGCGPGFFTVEMARMVGQSGRVIASDVQEGMLQILQNKIQGTDLEERIVLHKCETGKVGIEEQVDFILAFYVLHEIPHQEMFFKEIESILKENGLILIVEPPFHVSRRAFKKTVKNAENAGLTACERPKVFFSKTVIMKKNF